MKASWKRGVAVVLLFIVGGVAAAAFDDGEPGKLPLALPTTIPPTDCTPTNTVVPVQMVEVPKPDAAISLEWSGPSVIRINQPNVYKLNVKNVSSQAVQKVTVQVRAPKDAKITATTPQAKVIDGVQLWELDTIDFKQSKELSITLVPTTRGEATCQAWVTFTGTTGMKVRVEEPKIEVTLEAPKSVQQGEEIPLRATIKNVGDTKITNLEAEFTAEGHVRPYGQPKQNVEMDPGATIVLLGTVNEAVAKEYPFHVKVAGRNLEARHDPVFAEATCKTIVLSPEVKTTITGPKELMVGRVGTFAVKVENTGAVPVTVQHECPLPTGWRYVNPLEVTSRKETLEPGQKRERTFQAIATQTGDARFASVVTGDKKVSASHEHTTTVVGIAALHISLMDKVDPVEKGKETTYQIVVTNTGTQSDANIVVSCPIPKELKFVKATGPVDFTITELNGVTIIKFAPIRELSPKTEASFQITVAAIATGDIRFKAVMNSPSLSTSVVKEESTRVYGE